MPNHFFDFAASAEKLHWPTYFPKEPPSIYNWFCRLLRHQDVLPFPYLAKVSKKTKTVISVSLFCCLIQLWTDVRESCFDLVAKVPLVVVLDGVAAF